MIRDFVKKNSNLIYYLLLGLTFLILLFTRLYKLGTLPTGLHIDEAASYYTAYCIGEYGVDRYLNSYPIYFNNFASGQSPMYVYLLALFFKIFPINVWTARIPITLFSILNWFFGIRIGNIVFDKNKTANVLIGLLIAICPVFIFTSRFGLDCYLLLGMSTVMLYFVVSLIQRQNNGTDGLKYYIICGCVVGVTLYTYAISYIIIPLFLVFLFVLSIRSKRLTIKKALYFVIPLFIISLPLVLYQVVNIFNLPELKIGVFSITHMGVYRGNEIGRLTFEKLRVEVNSIFIGDYLDSNSTPKFMNLYGISLIFAPIGFVYWVRQIIIDFKKKVISYESILLIWAMSCLICLSLTFANVNKTIGIYTVVAIMIVNGIMNVVKIFNNRAVVAVAIGILYLFWGCLFIKFYFTEYRCFFSNDITEGICFIESDDILCRRNTWTALSAIIVAAYDLPSPQEYSATEVDENYNNWKCHALPAIEDGCSYIVDDSFVEYSQELRNRGFSEEIFDHYSVFYKY